MKLLVSSGSPIIYGKVRQVEFMFDDFDEAKQYCSWSKI